MPAQATPSSVPRWSFETTSLDPLRKRRRSTYWVLLLFLDASIIVGVRLIWAQHHFRPPVLLTDDLEVRSNRTASYSGLDGGFRLVEVDGHAIRDRRELHVWLDTSAGTSATIRARKTDGSGRERVVLWRPVAAVPRLAVADDLSIAASELDPKLGSGSLRVLQINGEVPGDRVVAMRSFSRPRSFNRLTVQTAEGREIVDVVFFIRSWRVQWALWSAGLAFGLVGWGVLYLKPNQRSSWGFAFFALGAGLFSLLRSIPDAYRLPVECYVYLLLQVSLPLFIAAFLGTFTPLRHLAPRLQPWLYGAAAFGACMLALDLVFYREWAAVGLLGDVLFLVWLITTLALVLIAQPADLYCRLRGILLGATDRQRARILRLASLAAFAPLPLFYLGMYSGLVGFEARPWFELAILIFPIAVAYAEVRHTALEINELMREALLAGGLLLALAATYALSAAALVPLATSFLPRSAAWVQPVVMAGAIFALTPLYMRGRAALHRRFEQPPPGSEALVDSFDQTLAEGISVQQFCGSAVRRVSHVAGMAMVHLLLWSEKESAWLLAATTGSVAPGPDHDRAVAALSMLRSRDEPLLRDDLIEDLEEGVARTAALDGMRELGAAVLLPLVSGGRLVGALAVGDRPNGKNLTAGDLRMLHRARGRLAQQLVHLHQEYEARMRARRIIDLFPHFPPRIGPFEIERVLGEGGTSFVYLGRSASGSAAVKVPNDKVQSNARAMARFRRESLAMQRLDHPNIARVLEVGWHGREPYIAFEYFSRGSVDAQLEASGPFTEQDALAAALQVVNALSAALEQGVIHRDVKLRNLFLAEDSTIKLGDFGLALVEGVTTLTTHPVLMGTPAYLSPEQVLGKPATWRSDQYSLGICLYELLTREHPFWAETLEVLLLLQVKQPLPDVRVVRPSVSTATCELLRRMTAKKPEARFESYEDLATALGARRQIDCP